MPGVTPRTLRVLEFQTVCDRLAALCTSPLGREEALQLRPSMVLTEVARWQRETSEARLLAETAGGLPLSGVADIRAPVHRASIGGILAVRQLLDIRDTVAASRTLKGFIAARREDVPALADLIWGLGVFPEIEEAVGRAIGPDGAILDGASPDLARVRRERRVAETRLRDRLEEIVRSSAVARMLQEPLVTIRGDRYTVPVRAEFRHHFQGVAHDQSSSGMTVFMEPLAVVPLGNRLRELASAEQEEVTRILEALSRAVGEAAEDLAVTVEALARLDVVAARARLSMEMGAAAPRLNAQGILDLRGARHPLLQGPVVPIDVRLGRRFRTLIITGPNTGGKTVTLKTMGLITLMAQAGMHIPAAPESEVAVFPQVYADIGDEQSIVQNLSTFSSHLTAIIEILRALGEDPPGEARALVLLDEVGAGTDPTEGVALARAIIEALHTLGACTAVTTHYNELKALPYTIEGAENASVEFDEATLRPTFRLLIGTPGRSNAFAIAERLGLDPGIVERARGSVSRRDADLTHLLESVEGERETIARERDAIARARGELAQLRARVEEDSRRLDAERRQSLARATGEVDALVRRGRRELDALLAALRERPSAGAASRVRASLRDLTDASAAYAAEARVPPAGAPPEDLRAGETVLILSLDRNGVVQAPPDSRGEVEVQAGTVKVRVPLGDLRRLAQAETPEPAVSSGAPGPDKAMTIPSTLDLRGRAADDAIAELDKYLDDATLAGLDRVTVIHGKGTGALRRAVRDHLSRHPEVVGFRLGGDGEGGSGATIIDLARA